MEDQSWDRQELYEAVQPWLVGREQILWVGRPQVRRFRGEILGDIGAGLILVAINAFAGFLFVCGFLQTRRMAWIALFIVPAFFLTVAYHYLSSPRRHRQILGRTIYAVTTDRAFLINGFGHGRYSQVSALDPPDQCFGRAAVLHREVKRRRRDGSGDIIFESEGRAGYRNRTYLFEVGFFGVADVDKVDAFLNAISGSKKSPDRDLA